MRKALYVATILSVVLVSGCGDSCWQEHKYDWELYAVGGCDESSVFAVGDLIVRSTSSGWSSQMSLHGKHFYSIWCVSPSDVYVAGGTGEIFHYNGEVWEQIARILGENDAAALLGLWGGNDGQMFAVGTKDDEGIVLRQEGIDWIEIYQEPQESFKSIWGNSATDIYVTGKNHVIHYNGSVWSEISIEDEGTFWDVSGVSSNEVYILSKNNIWMIGDAGPSLLREIPALSLSDLHAPRTGELYAAGKDYSIGKNQILRYKDGKWKDIGGGINNGIELDGIWTSQEGKTVAVGNEQIESGLQGVLLEYTCD